MSDPRNIEYGEPTGGIVDDLIKERNELKAERDELTAEVERLKSKIITIEAEYIDPHKAHIYMKWKSQQQGGG